MILSVKVFTSVKNLAEMVSKSENFQVSMIILIITITIILIIMMTVILDHLDLKTFSP